jgi:hypothetical protein
MHICYLMEMIMLTTEKLQSLLTHGVEDISGLLDIVTSPLIIVWVLVQFFAFS